MIRLSLPQSCTRGSPDRGQSSCFPIRSLTRSPTLTLTPTPTGSSSGASSTCSSSGSFKSGASGTLGGGKDDEDQAARDKFRSFIKNYDQCVAETYVELKEALRRSDYATATSYQEALSTYRRVLLTKQEELATLQKRRRAGLDKLRPAAGQLETLQVLPPSGRQERSASRRGSRPLIMGYLDASDEEAAGVLASVLGSTSTPPLHKVAGFGYKSESTPKCGPKRSGAPSRLRPPSIHLAKASGRQARLESPAASTRSGDPSASTRPTSRPYIPGHFGFKKSMTSGPLNLLAILGAEGAAAAPNAAAGHLTGDLVSSPASTAAYRGGEGEGDYPARTWTDFSIIENLRVRRVEDAWAEYPEGTWTDFPIIENLRVRRFEDAWAEYPEGTWTDFPIIENLPVPRFEGGWAGVPKMATPGHQQQPEEGTGAGLASVLVVPQKEDDEDWVGRSAGLASVVVVPEEDDGEDGVFEQGEEDKLEVGFRIPAPTPTPTPDPNS